MSIRSYSSIVIKHILYLSKKGFSPELIRETITVYTPRYKVPSLKGIKYIIQYYKRKSYNSKKIEHVLKKVNYNVLKYIQVKCILCTFLNLL